MSQEIIMSTFWSKSMKSKTLQMPKGIDIRPEVGIIGPEKNRLASAQAVFFYRNFVLGFMRKQTR